MLKICTRFSPKTQNRHFLSQNCQKISVHRHSLLYISLKQCYTIVYSQRRQTSKRHMYTHTHTQTSFTWLNTVLPRYLKVPIRHLSAVSKTISTTEIIPLVTVLHPTKVFVPMAAAMVMGIKQNRTSTQLLVL